MTRDKTTIESIATMKEQIKTIHENVGDLKSELAEIKSELKNTYATKSEFEPIKKIVYGLVASLLLYVLSQVLATLPSVEAFIQ